MSITTAWLHSTKPELSQVLCSFKSCSKRVRNLQWWGSLTICPDWKLRLNILRWSTIQQKQFIISVSWVFKIKSVKNNIAPSNKTTKKQERLVCNYLIVFFSRNIFFFLGLVFLFLLLCMVCELGIHYRFLEVPSFVVSKISAILKMLFENTILLFNFNVETTSQTNFHKYVDIILISHFMEKFQWLQVFQTISVQCNDLVFSK